MRSDAEMEASIVKQSATHFSPTDQITAITVHQRHPATTP